MISSVPVIIFSFENIFSVNYKLHVLYLVVLYGSTLSNALTDVDTPLML